MPDPKRPSDAKPGKKRPTWLTDEERERAATEYRAAARDKKRAVLAKWGLSRTGMSGLMRRGFGLGRKSPPRGVAMPRTDEGRALTGAFPDLLRKTRALALQALRDGVFEVDEAEALLEAIDRIMVGEPISRGNFTAVEAATRDGRAARH